MTPRVLRDPSSLLVDRSSVMSILQQTAEDLQVHSTGSLVVQRAVLGLVGVPQRMRGYTQRWEIIVPARGDG
jgi:hypothetical protein